MGKQEPLAGKLLVRKAFPIALGDELIPSPLGTSHPLARSDHPPAGGQGRDQLGTSPYPTDLTSTRPGKRSDLPKLIPGVGKGLEGRGMTGWGMGCLP